MVHTLAFRELQFRVGTMGGAPDKRSELIRGSLPLVIRRSFRTDPMPAFLAAQSGVLFFHPDEGSVLCELKIIMAVRPARTELFVVDVMLPFPRFQRLISAKRGCGVYW
jgi:hypothetical protein